MEGRQWSEVGVGGWWRVGRTRGCERRMGEPTGAQVGGGWAAPEGGALTKIQERQGERPSDTVAGNGLVSCSTSSWKRWQRPVAADTA